MRRAFRPAMIHAASRPALRLRAAALGICLVAWPVEASQDGAYAEALRIVQASLDGWLGKGRAVLIDRSAPLEVEAARLTGLLGPEGRKVLADRDLLYVTLGGGTRTYGRVCLAGAGEPGRTASDILSVQPFAKAVPGDVGDRDAYIYDFWSASALCKFEFAKDSAAMAVLAAARDSASRDLPGLVAASMELSDWSDIPGGNAGVSGEGAQWAALKAYDLRSDGRLKGTPRKALARMARVAAAQQPSGWVMNGDVARLIAARDLKGWYVPVREGAVSVDWRTWLRQSRIPEAVHYGALLDRLEGLDDRRVPVVPLSTLRKASPEGAPEAAARHGDTGAAAFVGKFGAGSGGATDGAVPTTAELPSWESIKGMRIGFDRATASLHAPGDGAAFEIRETSTGRAIRQGTAASGLAPATPGSHP